jgi:RND family efflux transporter MFP subunit
VQRAQAALANARANQVRSRDLFARGVAARKDVEDADRAVADAEAALAQAQASLAAAAATSARSVVRATFSGVIAKRFHNPGDLVDAAAADPVLRVIDPRRLDVLASVPLTDSSRIIVGAAARLAATQTGHPEVGLKVISRPAAVEPGTASVPIRVGFNAPTTFPAGMPVQLDIDAEEHTNAVLIPAAALVREGEETAVFVVAGDKAERRAVQIGLSDGIHVEIVSGVKAGEMVIVDGQQGLPDGAPVTLATGGTPEAPPAPADAAKDDGK